MKRKRYSEEQIAFALRQQETGTPVAEVIRKLGISEQTFYRWKKKFAGLGVAEVRRLKLLEEKDKKLKALVADLSLDKQILQDVLSKSPCRVPHRPRVVSDGRSLSPVPWAASPDQFADRRFAAPPRTNKTALTPLVVGLLVHAELLADLGNRHPLD